jgi:D-alanyl-D-alanine carboxypeptidase
MIIRHRRVWSKARSAVKRHLLGAIVSSTLLCTALVPSVAAAAGSGAQSTLQSALDHLVATPEGPPGVIAVVQHGNGRTVIKAGTAETGKSSPLSAQDHIRVASVSKAFNGAAALALVARHTLSLDDTIGKRLPSLPEAWDAVTLAELLHHTSGIPDFSDCPPFRRALVASLLNPPPPAQLLRYVETPPCYKTDKPLEFTPGTKYEYSNSDNVIVALMIEAVTNEDYSTVLTNDVLQPLGLTQTSLPSSATIPEPFLHGYDPDPPQMPEDVSQAVAAGWSWASGGVVSTPADANRFVRAYVKGSLTDVATRSRQFSFVDGTSEPPGPGTNSAGLALFRYQTDCGTVYGHTGNTLGYTQFIAASSNGHNSVSITVNEQITPKVRAALFPQLRKVFELGVCAATKG